MKKIFTVAVLAISFFAFAGTAQANEGQIELRNTVGQSPHCYAVSGLFPNGEYNIEILCRDLIYPISSDLLTYVVWGTPANGGNPFKLGDLGVGKAYFKTKTAFTSLFVTQERDEGVRSPSGPVAMQGNVAPIPFLDTQSPAQPGVPEATLAPTPSPTPRPSAIANFIRGGGIITAVAVFVVILMLILVKPFK